MVHLKVCLKKFKKLLSVVVAAMICLSITVPSQAAELNGTMTSLLKLMEGDVTSDLNPGDTEGLLKIQFSGTAENEMFSAHKLLDIANNSGDLTVTIPSGKAQEFWNAYTGKTVATISDIKTKLNEYGSDPAAQSNSVIQKFLELGDEAKPDGVKSSVVDGKAQIATDFGFYFIQQIKAPSNGHIASAPILACLPMQ